MVEFLLLSLEFGFIKFCHKSPTVICRKTHSLTVIVNVNAEISMSSQREVLLLPQTIMV